MIKTKGYNRSVDDCFASIKEENKLDKKFGIDENRYVAIRPESAYLNGEFTKEQLLTIIESMEKL